MKKYSCLFFLLFFGCQSTLEVPQTPLPVRASDLVQSYRDQTKPASAAYDNINICVIVKSYLIRENEIHWFVGGRDNPPAIIFKFSETPTAKGSVTIMGMCRGRIEDGKKRDVPGTNFYVMVTDCQVLTQPIKP